MRYSVNVLYEEGVWSCRIVARTPEEARCFGLSRFLADVKALELTVTDPETIVIPIEDLEPH